MNLATKLRKSGIEVNLGGKKAGGNVLGYKSTKKLTWSRLKEFRKSGNRFNIGWSI